jgi:hypothetical protein
MDFMTPDERFTRIENALQALVEHHLQHAEEIHELRNSQLELQEMHKGMVVAIGKLAEWQRSTSENLNALIETVDRIIRERNGGHS